MAISSLAESNSDREITFSRLIHAPRALVWKVWSDAKHLHRWWGPVGFTTTTQEFDFTPGGMWRHVMHAPNGIDYPTRVIYREIDPPSRLVYDNSWDLAEAPIDFRAVVTFAAEGIKTQLSQHMTFRDAAAFKTAVELYGVIAGGTQTFDRIAHYVETGEAK